jgi:hypothetical protein
MYYHKLCHRKCFRSKLDTKLAAQFYRIKSLAPQPKLISTSKPGKRNHDSPYAQFDVRPGRFDDVIEDSSVGVVARIRSHIDPEQHYIVFIIFPYLTYKE